MAIVRQTYNYKYLTVIGRGEAKYRDLSVASTLIICRSRRPRQIIDLRETPFDHRVCFSLVLLLFSGSVKRTLPCTSRVTTEINWFPY